jgi:hypothetical protein
MRRLNLALITAGALTMVVTLGGCSSWDPSDLADLFQNKKPLPGDRKPVFPTGVPGVPQGVPPELTKGYQENEAAQAAAAAQSKADEPANPESARPKAKPKPQPKPKTASAPPRPPQQQPQQQRPADDSVWPAAPSSQQRAKPGASSPWPD